MRLSDKHTSVVESRSRVDMLSTRKLSPEILRDLPFIRYGRVGVVEGKKERL
jgi:hypothetical protein